MKIKELKGIAYSSHGDPQMSELYDYTSQTVVARDCTIDYIVEHYGDLKLTRIQAYKDILILEVRT